MSGDSAVRWLIALPAGFFVAALGLALGFVGQFQIQEWAVAIVGKSHHGFEIPIAPKDSNGFYQLFGYSLAVVAGVYTALVIRFSDELDEFGVRRVFYIIILLLLLPFSVYNYSSDDSLIKPNVQAIINTIMIFVGGVIAVDLQRFRVSEVDARVGRAVLVFGITLSAIFVPLLFNIAWFLVTINVITAEEAHTIAVNSFPSLAGLLSAFTGVLSYLSARSTEQSPSRS